MRESADWRKTIQEPSRFAIHILPLFPFIRKSTHFPYKLQNLGFRTYGTRNLEFSSKQNNPLKSLNPWNPKILPNPWSMGPRKRTNLELQGAFFFWPEPQISGKNPNLHRNPGPYLWIQLKPSSRNLCAPWVGLGQILGTAVSQDLAQIGEKLMSSPNNTIILISDN